MSRKGKGISLHHLSASAQAQALAKLAELDRPPVITPEQADAIAERSQWAPYRNKTEWRFAAWLADHYSVATIAYECLKIQIGTINGKPSWYMPDFVRVSVTGEINIYEVKGGHRFREKGIERLRNAASRWPGWTWWLAEPNGHGWSLKRVEG
jgi:hypothetical protein